MKHLLVLFLIVAASHSTALVAQSYTYEKLQETGNSPQPNQTTGSIEIVQDSRIDSIVAMHIAYNKYLDGMMGYRVQIFFDAGNNSLDKANQVSEEFRMLYPTDSAYISFSEPYYKVRVGDFRTRLEAEGYMQKITRDYPNAFVIKDMIRFPALD